MGMLFGLSSYDVQIEEGNFSPRNVKGVSCEQKTATRLTLLPNGDFANLAFFNKQMGFCNGKCTSHALSEAGVQNNITS